jgi:rubrerythrin
MNFDFNDLGPGGRAHQLAKDAKARADGAARAAGRAVCEERDLGERLHNLSVKCAALWELLKEKTGATDEQLAAKVKQIEQAHATPEGQSVTCAKCGLEFIGPQDCCPYCGHVPPAPTDFDSKP